jgi:hypothetical protein
VEINPQPGEGTVVLNPQIVNNSEININLNKEIYVDTTANKNDKKDFAVREIRQEGNINLNILIPATVNKVQTTAVIDTASRVTVISWEIYNKLDPKPLLGEQIKLK